MISSIASSVAVASPTPTVADVSPLRISGAQHEAPSRIFTNNRSKLKVKLIMSSNEMLKHAGMLRAIADRFEQAAKAKLARKIVRPNKTVRAAKTTPSGMTAELVKLALRAKGVTPAQLYEHSKWSGKPWRWWFTKVADRFGYTLKVKRDGRAVTYFLTAKS
jgi:hypothetical protein